MCNSILIGRITRWQSPGSLGKCVPDDRKSDRADKKGEIMGTIDESCLKSDNYIEITVVNILTQAGDNNKFGVRLRKDEFAILS